MLILSHKTGKITNVIVNEGREIIIYNILQNLKIRDMDSLGVLDPSDL